MLTRSELRDSAVAVDVAVDADSEVATEASLLAAAVAVIAEADADSAADAVAELPPWALARTELPPSLMTLTKRTEEYLFVLRKKIH